VTVDTRTDESGQRRPVEREQLMSAGEAQEIRDHHWPAYADARTRIQESRDFLAKKIGPRMHKNFRLAGADSKDFRPGLPQQMTAALKLRNLIASSRPELSRFAGGEGAAADAIATNLEEWGEAGMDLIYPDGVVVDLLQNEGEGGVLMRPAAAGWLKRPDPKDPIYRRDGDGRKPGDPYFSTNGAHDFRLSLSRSSAAYERALQAHLSRCFPIECDALSLSECAPINPRWVGDRVVLDGLVRERTFTVSELQRKRYRWFENGRLVEPDYANGSQHALTLLETWLTDEDDLPFVSYSITNGDKAFETKKLARDGTRMVEAQIDLSSEWGITTLPIAWEYGWHWAVPKPGDRGIPFIYPFIEAFLSALNMLGGVVAHTHLTGFGGWVVLKDPRQPGLTAITSPNNEPITAGPLEIVELEGRDLKPLVHNGASPMAVEMLKLLLGSIQDEGPPSGAFGGAAESGLDRTVMMRQVEHAVYDITNGRRRLYERAASHMLMVGCAIGMSSKLDVPIYKNVEVPESGKRGQRNIVVLHPDDTDEVYDYQAVYPTKPGDNLALAAQLWNFYIGGGILEEEWREWAFGDKHPETFRAKKVVEQIERSPVGQADVIDYAAQKIADEKLSERIKAMAKGTLFPDGSVPDMNAGLLPSQPAGPGDQQGAGPGQGAGVQTSAVAGVDPGQSALAGHIGGALAADRAAAAAGAPGVPGAGPGGL
jgi:hypothetical protein